MAFRCAVNSASTILYLRSGQGIEGAARGVGVALVVDPDLPVGVEGLDAPGIIAIRNESPTNLAFACGALARAVVPERSAERAARELYEFLRVRR